MMVEAEATENTIELIAGGATKPTEEVVAEGLEAAKPFIAELCRAQAELAAGRRQADRRVPGLPRLPATTSSRPSSAAVSAELAAGADHRRQAGARGRARRAQGRGQGARSAEQFEGRDERDQPGLPRR